MKRLERAIAVRMVITMPLLVFASVSRGPLRWVVFIAALALIGSIFLRPRSDFPEHLTVTISEYSVAEGQLRISGVLTNSGGLDVYRPELNFRLEGERGNVLASHSIWPTGQVKRIVSTGQSAPFALTLPAPSGPERTRLLIRSPQYPFDLVMTGGQSADVPPLRAV